MYIKIVDRETGEQKMIEATEYTSNVVEVQSTYEFDLADYDGLSCVDDFLVFGSAWGNAEPKTEDSPMEDVVSIVIPGKSGDRAIFAAGCSVYVMGDNGKTIDVIMH